MKFFSRVVAIATLSGAASSAYAKETSASIIVSDSHINISALQATEKPRRQLRKLLVTAQKAKSESALRLDAKEKAYKERSGVRHLQTTPAPKPSKADKPTPEPTSSPSFKPSAKPSASPSLRPSASPSAKPSDKPSLAPNGRPSAKPSASPSLKPSGSPSAKPSDKPSLAPSGAPSEAPSSSPVVKTPTPTPTAQGGFTGGINVDQCAATAPDYCVCGDCNEDTCKYSNNGNSPLAICLKPVPGNSCGPTDTLTVTASPDKDCEGVLEPVIRNAESGLCKDGWYVTKDVANCKQQFVNNYSVKTPCVNNNLAVDIHTSCSCELALCMKFNGYVFTGYNVPSQGGGKTWIVSGDDCNDLQDTTPGPVGCSVNPTPTPPSPSSPPTPCTAPKTQCSGNCSGCCDGSVNCNKLGKYCGSDTSCSSLFGRA